MAVFAEQEAVGFAENLADALVQATHQSDFDAMVQDEVRVRDLHILGREEPFDADNAEGAARRLVDELAGKLILLCHTSPAPWTGTAACLA
ncbi:MAG: hypothetical protein H7837_14370 [Magnetococcus sp. MYC-9]